MKNSNTVSTGRFSIDSRIGQIFANEEAKAVFDRYLPGIRAQVEGQAATLGFSVRRLVSYTDGAIPESVLEKLDSALSMVEPGDAGAYAGAYSEEQPLTVSASERIQEGKKDAIYPGQVWRDTDGKRIQAHGGALFYEDGTYYWYGENKDRTDGKCPVWTWGIRAYASRDLYNWEDKGLIISPDLANPESGLYPEKHLDRPHIIKCPKTGKYVCWIKQSGDEACFLVLQADAFTGPYEVVREGYQPFGMKAGDFDMIVDEESGKGYLFMDADHAGIVGIELSGDFLLAKRKTSCQYEGLHAPFCREGVALFERGGKKYMFTSGMSGYIPNRSDCAVSNSWTEPFTSMGDPHREDATRASFNSQISQVFHVPDSDIYIAIADRWVPDYYVDADRADTFERVIASRYEPERYPVSDKEKEDVMNSPMGESADTSRADYVWLPVRFDSGMPYIRWQEKWTI